MDITILDLVHRYSITQIEQNGVRHNVGGTWYQTHKNAAVKAFEIEEDFLEASKTLKIL